MWGILIYVAENSIFFWKTKFWKEKSVEDMDEFTPRPTTQTTLVHINKEIWKHEFHDILWGDQLFKKIIMFHGECKFPNLMQVLHLNSITLFN
jgi:hypothetical protein